ncbi:branched-chain amino acid ABC transporter permease [Roseibium denhamense]|uniref:Predicted branched-chain amino acid permease (Azaleucine resistance) n=1 Tax=Roseibium denhamense TaxID=76305 RepID=A0ABY1P3N3_9HYPH|nr:AzlC family ABC transporter permease [Roseibium denhamense]MTI07614.1 branched-chain amino acid ABC transporter permease [Roseibium denhamense]SMP24138.1 Predicted branched-chain amino acid permease (azaleucine resistance) [Roseibium denhamense]
MATTQVHISPAGCLRGAALCFPAFPGIIALGMVFGTVAAQKGLTFLETLMINSLVFAGASQFVAMEIYKDPLTWGGLIAMVGVTGAVNMRMLLIGASLRPWLGQVPARNTYPSLFFLTDLNWLIALSEYDKGTRDWGIYLGSGLFTWSVWSVSVIPGYFAGSLISDPKVFGLDVVLPAFFAALLVPLWKGKRQTVSWLVAGAVACITWALVGGYWSIFTGAIAGALAGAYLDD